MQARTPVVVVLTDGELIRGTVEWYDRDCIKITRSGVPNLLLYKSAIKYIYKDESANGGNGQPKHEPALEHVPPDDNGEQNF